MAFAEKGLYYCESAQYKGGYNPDHITPPAGSKLAKALGPDSPEDLALMKLYNQGRCKKLTMKTCNYKYMKCYVHVLGSRYIAGGPCSYTEAGLQIKKAGNDPIMKNYPSDEQFEAEFKAGKCR